ncbi:tetratricopeptide repeat protein [Catellatospora sp. NPDC049609]|uniref:tetratricopeptide repeat protein n=1 Tax=Catellatospora sp. NPDC049609 TaxID=3155505 RepID=UPI003444A6E6
MAQPAHGEDPADPRAEFATALARLRNRLPDVSDEVLARRASATTLPSGRRVAVNARRVGEWLGGRSVPRDFEQVFALVRAVETATGGAASGAAPGPTVESWRRLWRAAHEHRTAARGTPPAPAPELVVGRPPSDAASLRQRPELAAAVDDALRDPAARQVVLTGPGGSGKSQLAAAAFHRARGSGGLLTWITASSRQSVLTGYARAWRALAGGLLDRPAGHEGRPVDGYGHDEETQADLLVAWLRATAQPWLVVLDDVDDPSALDGLWPIGDGGRSIVTTRRRDAAVFRPAARVVAVGMFSPAESVDYLRNRLSLDPAAVRTAPAGDAELADLAAALGHFPLALSQAAAFLIDTGIELAAYRRLIDDRRERLADLFPASSPADGHDRTVAGTWRLAAQRAAALAKPGTAQRMLELVSLLAPEGVPERVLLSGAACGWIGGTAREAAAALRALHRLSLLTHEGSAVAMHALVQRAVREAVPEPELPGLARTAADALEQAWTADADPAALYDSIEAVRRAAGEHLWHGGMHPVLRRIGEHLNRVGRATAARDALADLLRQARARLGDEHRDVLVLRTQTAETNGDLGDAAGALAALRELHEDARRLLGDDDADTLRVRLHIARQRIDRGEPAAALAELSVLTGDAARLLGGEHPLTLAARRYAALCLGLSGDAAAARDEFARLAQESAARLGEAHPETLNLVDFLGRWIGESGDAEQAVATYQRAADGLAAAFGPLHHDTLTARHNLAYWRALTGRLDQAVAEFSTAAYDAAHAIGPRHPTTLTFRTNLAYWRGLAGDPHGGMAELAGLLPIIDEVMTPAHPRALRTRQQHAELRHRAGDPAGARADLTAVLADMRRVQGDAHPRTREVADLLTRWTAES